MDGKLAFLLGCSRNPLFLCPSLLFLVKPYVFRLKMAKLENDDSQEWEGFWSKMHDNVRIMCTCQLESCLVGQGASLMHRHHGVIPNSGDGGVHVRRKKWSKMIDKHIHCGKLRKYILILMNKQDSNGFHDYTSLSYLGVQESPYFLVSDALWMKQLGSNPQIGKKTAFPMYCKHIGKTRN